MKKNRQVQEDYLSWTPPGDLTTSFIQRIEAFPDSVKYTYLKEEFLSKYVSPETDPPLTRRTRAINKWLAAERDNEATNVRLLTMHGEYNILPRVTYDAFMDICRRVICDIIGDTPPIDALIGAFSGGASTSRPRTDSHPASKYVGEAHVTPAALAPFSLIRDELPVWLGDNINPYREVVGNVLFTVPKKVDIDRPACKEPDWNMYLQKGIGTHFRKSLLRHKINLNDQSINRSLAREGSITNSLSTMDLSSASDSVTRELVFQLLPVTWFTLLDSVRSPTTVIDGDMHTNEMFSSMGNGFTFELESLLFYAITRTVAYFRGVKGVVSVYGDDIICPSGIYHYLAYVLGVLGFQVNPDKSFFNGPFRESCGGHYYDGFDITPFYLRSPIATLPDLIDVANKLRRWSGDKPWPKGANNPLRAMLDPVAEDTWIWLKSMVPKDLWGGVDTTFKYQLVSYDTPKSRISERSISKETGYGGYLHWLNATMERELPSRQAVTTSRRTVSSGKYRIRPARVSTVERLFALFYHEFG